ncbi:MAG: LysE family transporter [Oscillospiraceae bacterium]|nr:LysE family transporter [Oscillospiraceae bacterium]
MPSALIPAIRLPMLVLGAAYMLYLAWGTFRSSGAIQEDHAREGFRSGLLLQFINPKIYLYGVMSMEAYILPYYGGQLAVLLFFALLLAFIGFVFTLAWAAFGSVFRLLFSRHARAVNTVMALLLVYCAVSLFL